MTDLRGISEFRDYAAPADAASRARAHQAVAAAQRASTTRRRRSHAGASPSAARSRWPPAWPWHCSPVRAPIAARAILSESWTDLRDPVASRTREDRRDWNEPTSGFSVADVGRVPTDAGAMLQREVSDGRCTETLFTGAGGSAPRGQSPLSAIRTDVQAHRYRVIGVERSGGRRLLHLRWRATDPEHPQVQDRSDLWVDPYSYVPVRSDSIYGDPSVPAGDPNEPQRMTSDFELLRRPADPRGMLLPAVPAGASCPRTTRRVAPK